jgi:hypothetical protein
VDGNYLLQSKFFVGENRLIPTELFLILGMQCRHSSAKYWWEAYSIACCQGLLSHKLPDVGGSQQLARITLTDFDKTR